MSDPEHLGGSGRITVDGTALEYAWHGPGPAQAPTLVFLHEGLGCVSMWKAVPAQLAAATGYGAFVYTRRGYAGSDPCPLPRPVSYMHPEALEILPRVLAAAGVRECILIGHSDGGSIAIIHLGGNPAPQIRGAVTLGAHVFVEDITVASIAEARDRYLEGPLRESLLKYHGDHTDAVFWGWNDIWLDPAFKHWNIEEYLPRIQVPMLVMQGVDDPYGTPAQVQAIARGSGAAVETLMIPDCRHWPHLEQADTTLPAIADFAAKVLPAP